MTSDASTSRVYVWVWLPGETQPVVAGVLNSVGDRVVFRYAQSFQARGNAVPLYLPELPISDNVIEPLDQLEIAGCISDGGPDSWGQQLILRRLAGGFSNDIDELSPLTYLIESGSDRFGALDFQRSPTEFVERSSNTKLEELIEANERIQAGEPFSPELESVLFAGTSLGGARPKATLVDNGRELIAKFSSAKDNYAVVKAEGVAMNLARRVGLDVAPTQVESVAGRDVLLVDRFDRTNIVGQRRMVVSALTIFGLHPIAGYHASYYELAEYIRERFTQPDKTLIELFSRMVFNVCVGNTDDHARNHAAFWDGDCQMLTLTPAYDICPQPRSGGEASQAMAIGPEPGGRLSLLANCVKSAAHFHLSEIDAREVIDRQLELINAQWVDAADEATLSQSDKDFLFGRQILNPYCLQGY